MLSNHHPGIHRASLSVVEFSDVKPMIPKAAEFLSRLEQLCPDTNDDLVADLYEIVEPLKADPAAPELFQAIFRFFEMHPDADFGVPGPLVHLIEQHRGAYEQLLEDSVSRAPMYTTLQMVNRLLNADLPPGERKRWLSTFEAVAGSLAASAEAREQAEDYLEFQRAKG